MSITNKLNQIKNAIYGKEVRGAIHDAIKQVYDDASVNHDNANMEVKMARGTHNTLNDRLDNVDEIQAQTNAQLLETIQNLGYVTYEMFGALGDGVTDDFDSIKKCHDYANANKVAIKCQSHKKYRVIIKDEYIDIKTSVNFNNSTIIIDDTVRDHSTREYPLFRIAGNTITDYQALRGVNITKKTMNIPILADNRDKIIVLNDSSKLIYKRKGVLADNGQSTKECIIVDGNGNLRNHTIFEYDVTGYDAFEYNKEKLIICNGHFVHMNNGNGSVSEYYRSGFYIVGASNIEFNSITHEVIEANTTSYPQLGFIYIFRSADIVLKDCNFDAYKTYTSTDTGASLGSYAIRIDVSNNVTLENVVCSGFNDPSSWGVQTSNFMHFLTFKNCVLNRIDAHEGFFDVTIRDTKIGYWGVNAIGGGYLTLDNCDIYSQNHIVNLRKDYGSDFDGKVILNNCTWHPTTEPTNMISLVKCANDHTWDTGKICYFPNIEVNNLTLDSTVIDDKTIIYVVGNFVSDMADPFGVGVVSPYRSPKSIIVNGVKGFPIVVFREYPVRHFYSDGDKLNVVVNNTKMADRTHILQFYGTTHDDRNLGSLAFAANYDVIDSDSTKPNRVICEYEFNNCQDLDINLQTLADKVVASHCYVTRVDAKRNGHCHSVTTLKDCTWQVKMWKLTNLIIQEINYDYRLNLVNCRVFRPLMLNGLTIPNDEDVNQVYMDLFSNQHQTNKVCSRCNITNTYVEFGEAIQNKLELNLYENNAGWHGLVINATAWQPFIKTRGVFDLRPVISGVVTPVGKFQDIPDGFIYFVTDRDRLDVVMNGQWYTFTVAPAPISNDVA